MDKFLRLLPVVNALKYEVQIFVDIGRGEIEGTVELKKAVQDSIKEFCTTILKCVDKF